MGCSSSCRIFEHFSDALKWILETKFGLREVVKVLDDFLFLHIDGNSCSHYDVKSQSFNPGLQYPHLHGPVHTPDNNRWDTPPV